MENDLFKQKWLFLLKNRRIEQNTEYGTTYEYYEMRKEF